MAASRHQFVTSLFLGLVFFFSSLKIEKGLYPPTHKWTLRIQEVLGKPRGKRVRLESAAQKGVVILEKQSKRFLGRREDAGDLKMHRPSLLLPLIQKGKTLIP